MKLNTLLVAGLFCLSGADSFAQITNVSIGLVPNDGLGDPLRTAFIKLNANDNYLNSVKALTNKITLADIIWRNSSNGLNTVIFSVGDSMSDSPGGATDSSSAIEETLLKQRYGWAGAGPIRTVDTSVGNAILNRTNDVQCTNIYGGFSAPVYASDGIANVLSSKLSSIETTGPLTEIGVLYYKSPVGGTIRLIHTATGINETNVVSGFAATAVLAYTNFLITDAATDHKLTFASATLTNAFGGFIFRNSTNHGIEFYYTAKSGGTISNMLVMGTNSFKALHNQFQPNWLQYQAKDNDDNNDAIQSFAVYSNRLGSIFGCMVSTNGRVGYVATPQQAGNTSHIIQNGLGAQLCASNNWYYIPLGDQYPDYTQNNANGLMVDGSHPSTAGCNLWGQAILNMSGLILGGISNLQYYGVFNGTIPGVVTNHYKPDLYLDGTRINMTNSIVQVNVGSNSPAVFFENSIGAQALYLKGYNAYYQDFVFGGDYAGVARFNNKAGTCVFNCDTFRIVNQADTIGCMFTDSTGLLHIETGPFIMPKTVTAGGTTGNQTINKAVGTVNIAAAGSSVIVTNSFVTANSIISCTLGTVDATSKSAVVIAGSGIFTITLNAAATAEVRINWIVMN